MTVGSKTSEKSTFTVMKGNHNLKQQNVVMPSGVLVDVFNNCSLKEKQNLDF